MTPNEPSISRRAAVGACLAAVVAPLLPSTSRADEVQQQRVDAAISRALEYLAQEQTPDGSWRLDGYGEDTSGTSLAVMSFLAAGHVPDEGPYGVQITRGIRWVCAHQESNGMLVHHRSHGPMYSHGISTLMLAESLGMVGEHDAPVVRRALERGIMLILDAQAVRKEARHAGGWRYQVDSRDSDLSVTGWQALSLRAAKDAGCDVPAEAIDRAIQYVKNCSVRDNRGFGYEPGHGQTPVLTGTGITCLEVCGEHRAEESIGGADWLLANPLRYDSNYFFYGVYYTGIGMSKLGGHYAERTQERLRELLLPAQQADGCWEPKHGSEHGAGRVYATSLAVLALTVEYRYLPIYQR
ncbi:MAG: terpene cyclase/mutase family protein [Planctomyces sp.]|nr:terpene cyclase/mutase family protein [Planctomyces sp.]